MAGMGGPIGVDPIGFGGGGEEESFALVPMPTASGTAIRYTLVSASGTPALPLLIVSAGAVRTVFGAGGDDGNPLTLPALKVLVNEVWVSTPAYGTLDVPMLTATGATTLITTAGGSAEVRTLWASGAAWASKGTFGTADLPPIQATLGRARRVVFSTGTPELPGLTAQSAVRRRFSAGTAPAARPAVPAKTAEGQALRIGGATGAAAVPKPTAQGATTKAVAAESAVNLPRLTAQAYCNVNPKVIEGTAMLPRIRAGRSPETRPKGAPIFTTVAEPYVPGLAVAARAEVLPPIPFDLSEMLPKYHRDQELFQSFTRLFDYALRRHVMEDYHALKALWDAFDPRFDADAVVHALGGADFFVRRLDKDQKRALALLLASLYELKGLRRGVEAILSLIGLPSVVYEYDEIRREVETGVATRPEAIPVPIWTSLLPDCSVAVVFNATGKMVLTSAVDPTWVDDEDMLKALEHLLWMCAAVKELTYLGLPDPDDHSNFENLDLAAFTGEEERCSKYTFLGEDDVCATPPAVVEDPEGDPDAYRFAIFTEVFRVEEAYNPKVRGEGDLRGHYKPGGVSPWAVEYETGAYAVVNPSDPTRWADTELEPFFHFFTECDETTDGKVSGVYELSFDLLPGPGITATAELIVETTATVRAFLDADDPAAFFADPGLARSGHSVKATATGEALRVTFPAVKAVDKQLILAVGLARVAPYDPEHPSEAVPFRCRVENISLKKLPAGAEPPESAYRDRAALDRAYFSRSPLPWRETRTVSAATAASLVNAEYDGLVVPFAVKVGDDLYLSGPASLGLPACLRVGAVENGVAFSLYDTAAKAVWSPSTVAFPETPVAVSLRWVPRYKGKGVHPKLRGRCAEPLPFADWRDTAVSVDEAGNVTFDTALVNAETWHRRTGWVFDDPTAPADAAPELTPTGFTLPENRRATYHAVPVHYRLLPDGYDMAPLDAWTGAVRFSVGATLAGGDGVVEVEAKSPASAGVPEIVRRARFVLAEGAQTVSLPAGEWWGLAQAGLTVTVSTGADSEVEVTGLSVEYAPVALDPYFTAGHDTGLPESHLLPVSETAIQKVFCDGVQNDRIGFWRVPCGGDLSCCPDLPDDADWTEWGMAVGDGLPGEMLAGGWPEYTLDFTPPQTLVLGRETPEGGFKTGLSDADPWGDGSLWGGYDENGVFRWAEGVTVWDFAELECELEPSDVDAAANTVTVRFASAPFVGQQVAFAHLSDPADSPTLVLANGTPLDPYGPHYVCAVEAVAGEEGAYKVKLTDTLAHAREATPPAYDLGALVAGSVWVYAANLAPDLREIPA